MMMTMMMTKKCNNCSDDDGGVDDDDDNDGVDVDERDGDACTIDWCRLPQTRTTRRRPDVTLLDRLDPFYPRPLD